MQTMVTTAQASALLARNDPHGALAILDQVLAADPDDQVAHNEKGVALARVGRLAEALAWFAGVVQRFPRYSTAILNYIFLLLDAGEVDQAHTLFRSSAEALTADQQQQVVRAISNGQVPGMERAATVPLALRAFPEGFEPQLPPSPPQRPVFFIVGSPKSGTTWLSHLLNGHPEIRCAAETDLNLLATLFHELAFRYDRHLLNVNHHMGVDDYLRFSHADILTLYRTAVALLLRRLDTGEAGLRIGVKSPILVHILEPFHRLLPEARFIHVVRDGRDVTVSAWFNNVRTTQGAFRQQYPSPADFAVPCAQAWSRAVGAGRDFQTRHPELCHEVRYEDLHRDPAAALRAVLEFLDADTAHIPRCIQAGDFERLSGGRQQGEENDASFYRKGVPGDWRNHFSPDDEERFLAIAGPALRQMGYI